MKQKLLLLGLLCLGASANLLAQSTLIGQTVNTSFSGFDGSAITNNPVVKLFDTRSISSASPATNWQPTSNSFSWTASNLGQVFGIATDQSNIYVSAFAGYDFASHNTDPLAYGPGGSGGVYRLNATTGAITALTQTVPYNTTGIIGTNKIPNGTATNKGPGLGNICYNSIHKKLYVSNFEDGKIYMLNPSNGVVINIYDPVATANPMGTSNLAMTSDVTDSLPSPLGERVWALGYSKKDQRLYYSVWVDDQSTNNATRKNIIRSVAVDATGNFLPATDAPAIVIPDYSGYSYSSPVSDLEFSNDNEMTIAERTTYSVYFSYAHKASAYKYKKVAGTWTVVTTYLIGGFSNQNCNGGIDFSYSFGDGFNVSGCDSNVTMTGDYLYTDPSFGLIYGMEITKSTGNFPSVTGDYFIDYNNISGTSDKTWPGDVDVFREICPCSTTTQYVKNRHFDDGPLPTFRGQIDYAYDWFKATGDPDLFDANYTNCLPPPFPNIVPCGLSPLDYNCIGIPCNHFGYQQHRDPLSSYHRYGGMYSAVNLDLKRVKDAVAQGQPLLDALNIDERIIVEGAETELSYDLDTNTVYVFEMFVSKAEKGEVDLNVIDSKSAPFHIKMSTVPVTNQLLLFDPTNADIIYSSSVSDTLNWRKITFSFKPKKNYRYLIIESAAKGLINEVLTDGGISFAFNTNDFLADPVSYLEAKINEGVDQIKLQSYFYFDDISITEACSTGVTLTADAGLDVFNCSSSTPVAIIGGSPTAFGGVAPYSYSWTPNTNLYTNTDANPLASPSVTRTYTVTVTDALGNTATDNMTYYVANLKVSAGGDIVLCTGTGATIGGRPTASGGTGAYKYSWSPSTGLSSSTAANPTASPSATTTYVVTVTDTITGCIGTDTMVIVKGTGASYLINSTIHNGGYSAGTVASQRDQVGNATGWTKARLTPDLFDETVSCTPVPCTPQTDIDIPNNYFGTEGHRTITHPYRYAGLYSFNANNDQIAALEPNTTLIPDSIENIIFNFVLSGNLSEAMQNDINPANPNRTYNLELYASLAEYGEINRPSVTTTSLGDTAVVIVSLVKGVIDPNLGPISSNQKQVVLLKKVGKRVGWTKLSTLFRPNSTGYDHILIESFSQKGSSETYVYLDDVTIQEACDTFVGTLEQKDQLFMTKDEVEQEYEAAGINDNQNPEISIYPNPAKDKLNIEGIALDGSVQIEIVDVTGRVVTKNNLRAHELHLQLTPGSYLVKLYTEDVLIKSQKLIIQ